MSTAAIELLKRFAEDSEENSKIQRHEGFNEESVNSSKNAESYRDAVIVLELEYAQQQYHKRYSQSLALKS